MGRFTKGERVLVRKDGRRETVGEPPTDELWKLVDAKGISKQVQPCARRKNVRPIRTARAPTMRRSVSLL